MVRRRSRKPSCEKAFRERDMQLLERVGKAEKGNIWRSPLIEAMKRAGALVNIDEKKRLMVEFNGRALHIARLDLGMAEDFGCQGLCELAQELLAHQKTRRKNGEMGASPRQN